MKKLSPEESRKLRIELRNAVAHGGVPLNVAVKQMRKAVGLTQQQYADMVGLQKRQISEIERGVANPRLSTLKALGRWFGLEVGFILNDKLNAD